MVGSVYEQEGKINNGKEDPEKTGASSKPRSCGDIYQDRVRLVGMGKESAWWFIGFSAAAVEGRERES